MKYCTLLIAAGTVLAIGVAHAQPKTQAQLEAEARAAGPAPVKAIEMMSAVMPSTDFERSRTFYVKGMGATANRGANDRELVIAFPGGKSNIMLTLSAAGAAPRPPGRAILQVPDMKAFVAGLSAAGFAMKGRVSELPQYKVAVGNVEDPDGNAFEIIARLP